MPPRHPRVCLVVTSDPRSSPRPAEALRIASGLGASRSVDLTVYLHGPAIRVLSGDLHGLVDEEVLDLHWPALRDSGGRVMVQAGAAELAELGEPQAAFEESTEPELAGLLAASTYVLRF